MKYQFQKIYFIFIICSIIFTACSSRKDLKSENESARKEIIKSKMIQQKYADLLQIKPELITNQKLYAFIDEWYGTPYKYAGDSKKGIDCSSFTALLYNQVFQLPMQGPALAVFNDCMPLKKNNIKEGDLLFFKIDSDKISHIGIYLQNNKFVHASKKLGITINDLDEPYYKKYFYKAGRYKAEK